MHSYSSPAARTNTRRPKKTRKKHKTSAFKKFGRACIAVLLVSIIGWITISSIGEHWVRKEKLAAFEHPSATYVEVEKMPDYVWQAFTAIEDHRFPYHPGVDPLSIGRALWVNLSTDSKAQGAGTITMQLARNLFLTHDKTMERKLKEAAIAVYLEQRYTKQELLGMYLNTIYFGHGTYGLEKASQYYFSKTVRKDGEDATISLGEAALLASLPKAPESYSPVKHMKKAKQRQQLVLNRMEELGFITKKEKEYALKQPIVISKKPPFI
ncbi:transglycosylase domain-containing protein [Aneurinibacillus sp. REN35]|uniref:transglycosylase domain-containing protein n=2 Tax=Paenibacillaceae TaxID=186822 RepID=UPI0035279C30